MDETVRSRRRRQRGDFQGVESAPAIPFADGRQMRHGRGVHPDVQVSQAVGMFQGPLQEHSDGISVERLQLKDLAARGQRVVDEEKRVVGRGADEGDRPLLHVRQQNILLRLVEAVNLVNEQDGLRPEAARRCLAASRDCRSPATFDKTPLERSNARRVVRAMTSASEVFPQPAGP